MVLYFSGTGNSFAIARRIAQATDDQIMPIRRAAVKAKELFR